jgi:hypothetical protein
MKKSVMVFAALCALCSALNAQQKYYQGEGGKNLDAIYISPITEEGLAESDANILGVIQFTLANDFQKYAGFFVTVQENSELMAALTLTGTITKTGDRYYLQLSIKDGNNAIKASYGIQCTLEELTTLKAIKAASEELITGMGVTLTDAGKTALRTTATKEAEAMNALAKSAAAGATRFDKKYYVILAAELDPEDAEAAKRRKALQTEEFKPAAIDLSMPDIVTPKIEAPQFKAPETKMVATGNIGADARKQMEQYEAQKEVSRLHQESGNQALKELQDGYLDQFKAQSEAVKKQQAALMKQRDILLEQQRTLLDKQRETIADLHDFENSRTAHFQEHPPFEIIYDPAAERVGNLNLEQGTQDMRFRITSTGTTALAVIPQMLDDFKGGLEAIKNGLTAINAEFDRLEKALAQVETAGNSALAQLARDYAAQMTKVQAAEDRYAAELAKLDTALKTDGYAKLGQDYAVSPDTGYADRLAVEYAVRGGYNAANDKTLGETYVELTKVNRDETWTFTIEAALENDAGKTLGTAEIVLTNIILGVAYSQPTSDSKYCVFHNVPMKEITDGLMVSILRVNGNDMSNPLNEYINISPLEEDGRTKDGYDIYGFDKQGYDTLGYNKMGMSRKGRLGGRQRERNQAAVDKFIDEQLALEIFGELITGWKKKPDDQQTQDGSTSYDILVDKGIVGVNFIFRPGKARGSFMFPLGLMAEASLLMGPFDSGFMMNGHVGVGLRLAKDPLGKSGLVQTESGKWEIGFTYGLGASGGVSFIDNAVVPYVHTSISLSVLTCGLMFHFNPDNNSPDMSICAGLKFKFSANMQGAAEKRARKAQQL